MPLTKEELDRKVSDWQKQAREIPVTLHSEMYDRATQGFVYCKEWQSKEKARRAFRILGVLWGLALISVVVPLAHFVLVPGFLVAGPICALVVFSRENTILGGISRCPDCSAIFDISRSKVEWPLKDVCSHCHHPVKIINSRLRT